MGEKEREQLKERLLKMVVNEPRLESMPPMTMAEVMVNSMSKPNLEPLLDFISQEIEKAREEGYEECKKDMAVGVGLTTDTEFSKIVSKIADKLSKKK